MRSFLASLLLLGVGACAGATTHETGSSSQSESSSEQTGEAAACTYPANANTRNDASGEGCSPAPAGNICQVSNGATVLPDGGVSGGTESCTSLCPGAEYELTCESGALQGSIPDPAPSLGCTIIPIPTPSSALFYCCPCAN